MFSRPSRRLLASLRALHPFPSFLVAGATVALVPLADPGFPVGLTATLGVGMLCYQFAIGLANDIVDADDDAEAKPWKPVASGALPRRGAVGLMLGFTLTGLLVTMPLAGAAWLVGVGGLVCGLAYDFRLKRTALSWLPLAVAIPLVPIWVFLAADAWDALLWWVFPLGAVLGFALHVANQAPDFEADRARGVRGWPHRLAPRRARALAMAAFGLAASAAVLVLLTREPAAALYAAIAGFAVAVLAPRSTAVLGRDGLFSTLAAGSAVLGVIFVSVV